MKLDDCKIDLETTQDKNNLIIKNDKLTFLSFAQLLLGKLQYL